MPQYVRLIGTTASGSPSQYPFLMKGFHWGMAAGALGCIGLVQYKQRTEDKKLQGDLMFYHKSIGLLLGIAILPRLAIRMASKIPPLPAGSKLEHLGANASHIGAYGLLSLLPITGIAMGYYGGKGLPFFFTTIPGADKENKNGKLAGWSYKVHKYAGTAIEYLIPLHVGAVGFHMAKGHWILPRITGGTTLGNVMAISGTGVAFASAASARPSKLPPFPWQLPPL